MILARPREILKRQTAKNPCLSVRIRVPKNNNSKTLLGVLGVAWGSDRAFLCAVAGPRHQRCAGAPWRSAAMTNLCTGSQATQTHVSPHSLCNFSHSCSIRSFFRTKVHNSSICTWVTASSYILHREGNGEGALGSCSSTRWPSGFVLILGPARSVDKNVKIDDNTTRHAISFITHLRVNGFC